MMFMVPGVYASYVVGLAWVSNTLPRPAAKVSDLPFFSPPFLFSSFSLSKVVGREKVGSKKKGEVLVSETNGCFLGAEKAGFLL